MVVIKLFRGVLSLFLLTSSIVTIPASAEPALQPSGQLVAQMSGKLSEDSVKQALAAIQKAEEQNNVEGILEYVAPFVTSTITIESTDNDTLTVNLEGKEEHRELLSTTYSRIKTREIVNREVEVSLIEDGQLGIAEIVTVKAITTQDGKRYMSFSTQFLRFASIDNKPMIVSVSSRGWIAERPAQQ